VQNYIWCVQQTSSFDRLTQTNCKNV
jgi:hypothetical protein